MTEPPDVSGQDSEPTRPQTFASSTVANLPVPGDRINQRYLLGELIGVGSSGRVYAASDLAFDREVALKLLSRSGGDVTANFIHEARLTAQLQHPNIAPVHDLVWLDDGGLAFAMKRIEGLSLRETLQQVAAGRPPDGFATTNDIVTVFIKICDGVARAHSRGVVHRDIKPDNVIIGQYGEVIVLDWGEASTVVDPPSSQEPPVGTPLYMSPEQARGEVASPISDVYSIGATLFHCLVGRPLLVAGRDGPEVFWERRRRGEIDPPTVVEAKRCDRRLLAIACKCLRSSPADRYAAVSALAKDLAAFQAGQAITAYRESAIERLAAWHRHNARTIWLSTALLTALLLLGAALLGEQIQRLARWGSPALSERFDNGWSLRWKPGVGSFRVEDGRLISEHRGESTLMLREELPPHSAIEFTGQVLSGNPAQDLSVFWVEGPPLEAGKRWGDDVEGWMFQVGTWDNTCCVLRNITRGVTVYSPVTLLPGVPHRIRAEIDGDRQRLIIDGSTVYEHQFSFGANRGRWFLYTCGTGKVFSKVDIYVRGAARLVSAFDVPDALRTRGLLRDAAIEYRRIAASHAGSEFADRGYYKEGLTWSELDDWSAAEAAWAVIADRDLREMSAAIALTPLIRLDPQRLCAEIESRWAVSGTAGRNALIGLWNTAAQHMFERVETAIDGRLGERFLRLRLDLFPGAAETDLMAHKAAGRTGRVSQVLPDLVNPWIRGTALIHLGEWARLRSEGSHDQARVADQHERESPRRPWTDVPDPAKVPAWLTMALREGASVRTTLSGADQTMARMFVDRVFGDPRDSPSPLIAIDGLIAVLWIDAIAAGRTDEARHWQEEVERRDVDHGDRDAWIPALLAPVGIFAGKGRVKEARRALDRLAAVPIGHWQGAPAAWADALSTTGAPPDFLPGVPLGGRLVQAMRADLAGEQAAAALYRSWFAQTLAVDMVHLAPLFRLARWRGGLVSRP